MSNNRKEKIKALLDAGRLESVPFDAEFFSEQIKSCLLSEKCAQLHEVVTESSQKFSRSNHR